MPLPPMSKRVWCDLPHVLLERMLPLLPVSSLLKFRCVCKSWNSYILSPEFLAAAASYDHGVSSFGSSSLQLSSTESNSFLLFATWSQDFPLLAFNPSRESWHCPSLDFLEGEEVDYSLVAAAGGLLCFSNGDGSFVVCNPVTKAKKKIKMGAECRQALHDVVSTSMRTYREGGLSRLDIVVVGSCESSKQATCVYESSKGKWWISEKNSEMLFFESGGVFLDSDLMILTSFPVRLMVFGVFSATWNEHAARLPGNILFPCLVESAGSLLLLAAVGDMRSNEIADKTSQIASFKIWKLDAEANVWNEIAALPDSMLSQILQSGHFDGFYCVARDHVVHLSCSEGCIVYDSCLQAWRWLPESNLLSELHACIKDVYALEPTLDCLVSCSS